MCMNKEQSTMQAPKVQETREDLLNRERQEDLSANLNKLEAMLGQQAQLNLSGVLEKHQPDFLKTMTRLPAEVAVGKFAPPRKESHSEQKKRKDMEKQYRKAAAAQIERDKAKNSADGQNAADGYKHERVLLDKELKLIAAQESALIATVNLTLQRQSDGVVKKSFGDPAASAEALIAEFKWNAQEKRYEAYHRMALAMEAGSEARVKAMKKAEDAKVKADVLRRKHKVACMPQGAEREREDKTIKRHAKFDLLKSIFRKPTVYSREDAEMTFKDGEQEISLVNVGRATMGGTKAMYEFDERRGDTNAPPQRWLYKEATNCIGMEKPSGAVVTGEAYRLQKQLRGELSIPAYCVRVDGKVVGSVQKKMQRAEGGVDLFKWQAQDDLTVNAPSEVTMHDLMNEHTLDWVLCNFDTKGENFINQEGGHVISFDKEASFNKLLDDGAQMMSYTYKPHSNDTIYNTMFRAYAEGKIDLDLHANEESIRSIESQEAQHYADMFRDTLDAKYKAKSKDREKAEELLKNRFQTLRETYRRFYTELIRERLKHFQEDSEEHRQERDRLNAQLKNGAFRFRDE